MAHGQAENLQPVLGGAQRVGLAELFGGRLGVLTAQRRVDGAVLDLEWCRAESGVEVGQVGMAQDAREHGHRVAAEEFAVEQRVAAEVAGGAEREWFAVLQQGGVQGDGGAQAVAEQPDPLRVGVRVPAQPAERAEGVLDQRAQQRLATEAERLGEDRGLVPAGEQGGWQAAVESIVDGEGEQSGPGQPLSDVAVRVIGRLQPGDLLQDRPPARADQYRRPRTGRSGGRQQHRPDAVPRRGTKLVPLDPEPRQLPGGPPHGFQRGDGAGVDVGEPSDGGADPPVLAGRVGPLGRRVTQRGFIGEPAS